MSNHAQGSRTYSNVAQGHRMVSRPRETMQHKTYDRGRHYPHQPLHTSACPPQQSRSAVVTLISISLPETQHLSYRLLRRTLVSLYCTHLLHPSSRNTAITTPQLERFR
ncbi:unnamed protein product, partial [Ectocarpus sp. 12 AP-2014]